MATAAVLCILTLVGATGLLAAWSGAYKVGDQDNADLSFFLLLGQLPAWVVGIILVMVVALSTSAFDSFQSAMVSTGSNDIFRNKLDLWIIRICVLLVIIPVAIVALKSPDILQIYLISNLVSASLVPVLVVGLWQKAYFWCGFEVVIGSLGGILTVFIFGTIYYGNAAQGARLLLLENGLYAGDWGAFGAFVAAPVGGFLWAIGALTFRLCFQWIRAWVTGRRFDALNRVSQEGLPTLGYTSQSGPAGDQSSSPTESIEPSRPGKFF